MNCKNTVQRQIVLDELQSICSHPTAQQLHWMISRRHPSIGLATVYRALDFLEKTGKIQKLQTKKRVTRYDGNSTPHAHIFCKKCGEVFDIFDVKSVKIESKSLEKSGFSIDSERIELHGICKKCSNSKKPISSQKKRNFFRKIVEKIQK